MAPKTRIIERWARVKICFSCLLFLLKGGVVALSLFIFLKAGISKIENCNSTNLRMAPEFLFKWIFFFFFYGRAILNSKKEKKIL